MDTSSVVSSEVSLVAYDRQTVSAPVSVCVAVMLGYIVFGSMIFGLWENIGFGDLVPGERTYRACLENSFVVCSLDLTLGMAFVAMCFNLMQEQVIHYFACIKRVLKRICRCKR